MKKNLVETYALSPQLHFPWHPGRTTSVLRAAELLGCSQSTIIRLCQDGSLEAFKRRRNNSPYIVIYDSVIRIADQWRIESGVSSPQSTSGAATAAAVAKEAGR
jgi:hypothetical protein